MKKNTEIEVRFLEINKSEIISKLKRLGAIDHGESILQEYIFYDVANSWSKLGKYVRLRKDKKTILTFKHFKGTKKSFPIEIETEVSDSESAISILENIGLALFRNQEKKRHSFTLNKTVVDLDSWPSIPTYLEIEGESVSAIKALTLSLGLDWEAADYRDAKTIIEEVYNTPVSKFKFFTFNKIGL